MRLHWKKAKVVLCEWLLIRHSFLVGDGACVNVPSQLWNTIWLGSEQSCACDHSLYELLCAPVGSRRPIFLGVFHPYSLLQSFYLFRIEVFFFFGLVGFLTRSHADSAIFKLYVVKDDSERLILLSPPPQRWDSRCIPSQPGRCAAGLMWYRGSNLGLCAQQDLCQLNCIPDPHNSF